MTVGGTVRGERIGDGQWTSELPLCLEVCMQVLRVMNIVQCDMRRLQHMCMCITITCM